MDPSNLVQRDLCPACGSCDFVHSFSDVNRREGLPHRGTFVRCGGCSTLYLGAIPAPDALASAYAASEIDPVDGTAGGEALEALAARRPTRNGRPMLRALSRAIRGRPHDWPEEDGAGRRILDFGCNQATKLAPFLERGWQVAGIDLNQKAIERARARLPEGEWHAGPLESAPAWEPFDVIRSDNVLEHIPEPLAVLELLRRRLRPGGRLLLYVPSGKSLSVRLLRGRSQSSWIPFHLQLFSAEGLERLVRRAGFPSVKIHQFTPLSWWEMTARQAIAAPGFLSRPPSRLERGAVLAAKALAPVWLLAAKAGMGEELVADASA